MNKRKIYILLFGTALALGNNDLYSQSLLNKLKNKAEDKVVEKVFEEKNVDVVITDIVMPGIDGIEWTRIMKEKYDAYVTVMTSFAED